MGFVQPDTFFIGADDYGIGARHMVCAYWPYPPASAHHGQSVLAGAGGDGAIYLFARADYVCRCQRGLATSNRDQAYIYYNSIV